MDTLSDVIERINVLNNNVAQMLLSDIIKNHAGNRPLLIWGAGNGGVRIFNVLNNLSRNVMGFIDSNYKKQGTDIQGVKIYLPQFLSEFNKSNERPYIIVASMYVEEITMELEKMGFIIEQDFYVNKNLFVYFLR